MSSIYFSTRHQRFTFIRLPSPYLTRLARLFPRRSPPGLFTPAARGGLKPSPATRLRGAYPHLSRNMAIVSGPSWPPFYAYVAHSDPYT